MLLAFVPGDGTGELPLAHLPDTPHGPEVSDLRAGLTELERRQIVLRLLKACRKLNGLQLHHTLMAPAEL